MSGVWVSKNGVVRLEENPAGEREGSKGRRRVLVHVESNEVMASYCVLESKLLSLGWERFYDDPDLLRFHRRSSSVDLICLPKDFKQFRSMHMYDIVIKNPNQFEVREI
ncbi:flowering-promoting factor 1-like [Coffea arabica]|uniref:Flowering-promoting factor 1-like n=1 Tax=Coffea arabica TaxID=13443 RepID=A0A6P6VAA3_COFAR|nr:flowering-promoting factor 1-like [Coffea arabica]